MHKISNRIFEIFFKKTLDFLLAGFHKKVLKSPFTYIGTKKVKNSHLKIKFFQKNLRAAETAPKRGKNRLYYCIKLRKISFPAARISTGSR